MEEYCCHILYAQDVVVNHMIMHILYMMRLVSIRASFFIRKTVCDTDEIRANPGNFIGLSYIGHSDLHITYYGLPHVWYTLEDSGYRVCYATSRKSNCTLTGSL